jgi:two-component system, sensor histidine kinase and response regulator
MQPTLVLVVDDEERNQKLLKAMLARENLEIVAAANGEMALASIDVRLPDLILLDVMMPGLNGFEVCRRLKQDARTRMIPVLMVTALKEKEDRIMAMEAGADDFLSKPIDSTELLVRVKSLLRIKRYYDDLVAKNRQIQEKTIKLEELERLKEKLFHMVIHDLRNPLMSISGVMEIFQKSPEQLSQNQMNMVEICMRGCRELKSIIDSTLDIYRMDHGNMQLRKEFFDWKGLTEQIEPAFRVKAQVKGVQLTFGSSFEKYGVCGDRNVLSRVVSNLLDNAIRHTPDGGSIAVFSEPKPFNRLLRVSVKDSGNGIPREDHEKIFERFAQLPHARNGGRAGSCGLGLTFCKLAVETHGGRIWVESDGEGTGATFCFEIPKE